LPDIPKFLVTAVSLKGKTMKHVMRINRSLLALSAAMIMRTALADGGAADSNQANAAELAKKLQNPIANLISVPVQNNWDFGIGSADAMRLTANVQPVIPFSIGDNWNLITRTIMPIVHAESPLVGGSSSSGFGDIVQSFFLSPKEAVCGLIVGGGRVFLYPSASEDTRNLVRQNLAAWRDSVIEVISPRGRRRIAALLFLQKLVRTSIPSKLQNLRDSYFLWRLRFCICAMLTLKKFTEGWHLRLLGVDETGYLQADLISKGARSTANCISG
jgi:hypothetical protein